MGPTARMPAAGPALPPTSRLPPHREAPHRPAPTNLPLPSAPCHRRRQPALTRGRQRPRSPKCCSAAGVLGVDPRAGRFWSSLGGPRAIVPPVSTAGVKTAGSLKVGAFCWHWAWGTNGTGSQELRGMSSGGGVLAGGPWRQAVRLMVGLCQPWPTSVSLAGPSPCPHGSALLASKDKRSKQFCLTNQISGWEVG